MSRVRTLPEAIKYIKSIDQDTALTHHALRMLVLSGQFPHIKIGAKRLVDVDKLQSYLSGEYTPPSPSQEKNTGVIRPIVVGGRR